eukprot:4666179-Amphidinium_carterae.2
MTGQGQKGLLRCITYWLQCVPLGVIAAMAGQTSALKPSSTHCQVRLQVPKPEPPHPNSSCQELLAGAHRELSSKG